MLVGWHALYLADAPRLDRTYQRTPGFRGTYLKQMPRFFYFYHYTGKFPITSLTTRDKLRENQQTAWDHIAPRPYPSDLRNENYAVIRKGDLGQIFLLYPDFWRTGKTLDATPRTFNQGLALASSLVLFLGLSLAGHRLLAVLLVLLLTRRWEQLKLLVFYAPTSLPAFLVHSGGGFTHPTAFHLVGFALLVCWGVHAATGVVTARVRRRRRAEGRAAQGTESRTSPLSSHP